MGFLSVRTERSGGPFPSIVPLSDADVLGGMCYSPDEAPVNHEVVNRPGTPSLADGRVLEARVAAARGTADNPLSREELEAKCRRLAEVVLPAARVRSWPAAAILVVTCLLPGVMDGARRSSDVIDTELIGFLAQLPREGLRLPPAASARATLEVPNALGGPRLTFPLEFTPRRRSPFARATSAAASWCWMGQPDRHLPAHAADDVAADDPARRPAVNLAVVIGGRLVVDLEMTNPR